MLELALDKAFVDNFHLAYKDNEEYADDFSRYFIKNLQRCKLISNYENIDELMKAAHNNPLLELLIERIPKLEFRADFNDLIHSKDYPESGSPIKLVLCNEDDKECAAYRNRFGIEYLTPGNLKDRWAVHYSHRPDINRKTTDDPDIPELHRFESWDTLKAFQHPLNSIIIVDFYLLKWKMEKELHNNLDSNIIPLFEHLLKEATTDLPLNISIISEFQDALPLKQKQRVGKSLEVIGSAIKKITSRSIHINLIVHSKQNYPKDFQEFHDRLIITNYFYINCGAGFNIASRKAGIGVFDKPGKISRIRHNSEIQFRSILNIQNYWTAFKDLKQLYIYCKRLENHPGLPDYVNFLPDKKNRLLEIEHV